MAGRSCPKGTLPFSFAVLPEEEDQALAEVDEMRWIRSHVFFLGVGEGRWVSRLQIVRKNLSKRFLD